jgi:uncharacterized protein (TIGR02147 family)
MNDAVGEVREAYLCRKAKNPHYSMRAFATFLEISPGALSDIFARKRPLTSPVAKRIAARLFPEPTAAEDFLAKLQGAEVRASRTVLRRNEELEISEATLAMMTDLLHIPVLALFETQDFRPDVSWIASRFKLPVPKVQQILERLAFLGFIEISDGRYVLATGPTRTSNDVPSAAGRVLHKAILKHVIDGIDSVDVSVRDVQSLTLAIDTEKIPLAKVLIDSFIKTLSDFLRAGDCSEVYQLNIQLFPVTKVRN